MEIIRTLLEQPPLMALFLTIVINYLVGEIYSKGSWTSSRRSSEAGQRVV